MFQKMSYNAEIFSPIFFDNHFDARNAPTNHKIHKQHIWILSITIDCKRNLGLEWVTQHYLC